MDNNAAFRKMMQCHCIGECATCQTKPRLLVFPRGIFYNTIRYERNEKPANPEEREAAAGYFKAEWFGMQEGERIYERMAACKK